MRVLCGISRWSSTLIGGRAGGAAPGFAEQCRQLTEARAAFAWLGAGSVTVQQQALKDFHQAMANFFGKTHRKPTWRSRGRNEGFRIVAIKPGDVRRVSRNVGEVRIPKVGWVRFRWSRPVAEAKSYRVTRDASGRWHVAFAVIPEPIPAPGAGGVVGVDRGVAVSAALSTGEVLSVPALRDTERKRLLRLQRRLARAKRGSNRRTKVKLAIARLKARETDRRKDWVEKTSTDLARRFEVIAVEALKVSAMTRSACGTVETPGRHVRQKASLNRGILAAGWGRLVIRLEHKAPGRIQKINPCFTSQTCNACGHRARESRESQALFRCVACGHQVNADVNAARNIRDTAAGHAPPAPASVPWCSTRRTSARCGRAAVPGLPRRGAGARGVGRGKAGAGEKRRPASPGCGGRRPWPGRGGPQSLRCWRR
ncbi:transposase [Streptosporangium sp. NPDC048865]|uniref:RNA-guided endonuclease InsQ/TnpB family protein n=1 Tax=Streptosporangium sp. NPDC048865 TaxID=3155766 RepID=UPI00343F2B45